MRPLARSTRTKLFILSVLIFAVGVPLLIGYSLGYRFDTSFAVAKTGGIFIHAGVGNTYVYLDGELIERNGTFLKNTLIQNLTPNKWYLIELHRDGYHSWRKLLPVGAHIVTEGRALMLPTERVWTQVLSVPEATVATSTAVTTTKSTTTTQGAEEGGQDEEKEKEGVRYLDPALFEEIVAQFATPDYGEFYVEDSIATTTEEILLASPMQKTQRTTPKVSTAQNATTTETYPYIFPDWITVTFTEEYATTTTQTTFRERNGLLTWQENGNIYARWLKDEEMPPFYLCIHGMNDDVDEEAVSVVCAEEISLDWEDVIVHYTFYPDRDDVLLVQVPTGIYAVELDNRSERNIQPVYEGDVEQFHLTEQNALLIQTSNGEFLQTDVR
jgi:hypothetical protein